MWGSSTALHASNEPVITGLPYGIASVSVFSGHLQDATGNFPAFVHSISQNVYFKDMQSDAKFHATSPHTWATGHKITLNGVYYTNDSIS